MRTALATLAAAIGLLAVPAVAGAAAAPGLRPGDERQIDVLVDRFVKDAVLRENLRDGWTLIGPDLRNSTTKAKWIAGTGVTVEQYPARGHDFRHAWTGVVVGPGHVTVSVMLHPKAGHPHVPQTAFNADVVKSHGRWIVNGFYPAAMFYGGGHVVGPNDFGPGASAVDSGKARIRSFWLLVVGAVVAGLAVLVPAGFWIRAKRRDRRAFAEYVASTRS